MSGRSISGNLRRRRTIHKPILTKDMLSLRPMVDKDLEMVQRIEHLSFSNPWPRSSFQGEIDNHSISEPLVIIYTPEDRIIGYIMVWTFKGEAQISNIAVDPQYRRLGVGEYALRRILHRQRQTGIRRVFLEVRPSNIGAVKLYEKLGFRIIGKRLKYYKTPVEDALIMLKMIPESKSREE